MVLHDGKIEMKTGEARPWLHLPVYLNALAGKGVHVLDRERLSGAPRRRVDRDKIYQFLGMSVGVIVHGQDDATKRAQYAADITYGTNNEFGFDYLRDNMPCGWRTWSGWDFFFGIVDEGGTPS